MTADPSPESPRDPSVAVAVVCICGADHLARCLDALGRQEGVAPFQIVVRYDPALTGIGEVARRFPGARIESSAGQRTPPELASAALRACDADVLLLTEDHCVPPPDWVRTMLDARAPERAAIGGRIEIRPGASAVDWAFYYADFFRYADPVGEGPSPTLTVCNVAYDRARLEAIGPLWAISFEEPAVHDALRERYGALWLSPRSAVTMSRSVWLRDALAERYTFGRIFGQLRIARVPVARRWLYAAAAPALPALLLGRMTAKALRSPALARNFVHGFFPLAAMVVCWSWGEWLGYLTGRAPRKFVLARERAFHETSHPGGV